MFCPPSPFQSPTYVDPRAAQGLETPPRTFTSHLASDPKCRPPSAQPRTQLSMATCPGQRTMEATRGNGYAQAWGSLVMMMISTQQEKVYRQRVWMWTKGGALHWWMMIRQITVFARLLYARRKPFLCDKTFVLHMSTEFRCHDHSGTSCGISGTAAPMSWAKPSFFWQKPAAKNGKKLFVFVERKKNRIHTISIIS